METVSLLQYYRALEAASHQMLEEANSGRWDEVARIEQACKELIEQLRRAAKRHSLSKDEQKERMRIMHSIVLVDAQVRNLAQPWLKNLDRMFAPRAPVPVPPGAMR